MAGIGSNENSSRVITVHKNPTFNVNDSGVYNAPTTKGSGNIKIGQKGSLTIHNGPSANDLASLGASISSALTGIGTRSEDDSIDAAINDRIIDNIEQGKPSVVNSLGTSNWLLIGAGVVALIAVVFLKRKKK